MPCTAVLIENVVVSFILACGIEGLTALGTNIFVREKPERAERDPSPSCVVVVGDDMLPKEDPKTNSTNCYDYPVLVLLTRKGALSKPGSDHWRKEARFTIRNMLNRAFVLGGEGAVRRCVYNPNPKYDIVGLVEDIRVSAQLFVYRTEEHRTA